MDLPLLARFESFGELAEQRYMLEIDPAKLLLRASYNDDPGFFPWKPPVPRMSLNGEAQDANAIQEALYEFLLEQNPDPQTFINLIGENSPLGPDAGEKIMLAILEWNLSEAQRFHFTNQVARALETLNPKEFWNEGKDDLREKLLQFAGLFSKRADSKYPLRLLLEAGQEILAKGGRVDESLATDFADVCIGNRLVVVDKADPFHPYFMQAMESRIPKLEPEI